jgi:hypothetical protein
MAPSGLTNLVAKVVMLSVDLLIPLSSKSTRKKDVIDLVVFDQGVVGVSGI